ncbi:GTP-binding protein, partial [Photobacterium damselae]
DYDLFLFEETLAKAEPQKALLAHVENGNLDPAWLDVERLQREASHSHHHHHNDDNTELPPLPEFELAPGQQFIRKENQGQGY